MFPNKRAAGLESILGLDKSTPKPANAPNRVEPIKVKNKLTKNWIDKRRSFPNIKVATMADRTNIHAKEQMKPANSELDVNQEAIVGATVESEAATVDRAVWVKIW